ncbi:MAG: LptF/LptG family permease [Proteobacteria bacterium]|nr:LptF/LptG family permease [Pseudomonadota bacterium]
MPVTIYSHIAYKYLSYLIITMLSVAATIWLFDTMELMRIAGAKLSSIELAKMAALKNYSHLQHILPLIIFLSGLLFYSNLSYHHELMICRVLGMSIWQLLLPVIAIAVVFSFLCITVFNPIGSSLLKRYEHVESHALKGYTSLLSLAPQGIWLRQYDAVNEQTFIINSKRVNQTDHELFELVIFVVNSKGMFEQRIEAERAQLKENALVLSKVHMTTVNYEERTMQSLAIPTTLSFTQLQDSITPPETVPLFKLPGFIKDAQDAGFPVLRHKLYMYQLLTMPLFFIAMVLLSAGFVNLAPRHGSMGTTMTRGVLAVLVIHFANDIISAFGTSGTIDLRLAALLPALLATLLGCYVLLRYEEH